jgi:predicted nucleotidyltransferase
MTPEILRTKSASVVEALATIPEVQGVLCYGSYAMGTFDQHSDMDLYVVCAPRIVPALVRREVLHAIPAIEGLEVGHVEPGWEQAWHPQDDRCRVGDLQFDIAYNTVDWVRSLVAAIKDHGLTSMSEFGFRAYTVPGLLEHSLVLHDRHGTLQTLKASLYPYPSRLKQALLSENLPIAKAALEELQDYVMRSIGNTAFHFHYERFLDALGTILFAVNERYDPATKRTEEALQNLPHLPNRCLERYTRILETPLTPAGREEIVRSLSALLTDVEALAKDKQLFGHRIAI